MGDDAVAAREERLKTCSQIAARPHDFNDKPPPTGAAHS